MDLCKDKQKKITGCEHAVTYIPHKTFVRNSCHGTRFSRHVEDKRASNAGEILELKHRLMESIVEPQRCSMILSLFQA